jgi:hypothetical protein
MTTLFPLPEFSGKATVLAFAAEMASRPSDCIMT